MVDLDEMLAGVGRDADRVPLGTAAGARRHGERRRRRLATGAVAAAVLCVTGAGALVVAGRDDGDRFPADRQSTPPTLGTPTPYSMTEGQPELRMVGDRAVAGWSDPDGVVHVAGIDPATGKTAWGPRELGTASFGGLAELTDAVVVEMSADDGHEMLVLDAATGETRWRKTVGRDVDVVTNSVSVARFTDRLVLPSDDLTEIVAYDWATGEEQWRAPGEMPMIAESTADDVRPRGGGWSTLSAAGRLVQYDQTEAVVRDTASGAVLRTLSGLKLIENGEPAAFDGLLWTAETAGDSYRIKVFDLGGESAPRVVFTGAAGREFSSVVPCGDGRFCVFDRPVGEPDRDATITAVDLAGGAALWQGKPQSGAYTGDYRDGRLLVTGGSGWSPEQTTVYDENGNQLLDAELRRYLVFRGDGDDLMYLPGMQGHLEGTGITAPADVAKISARDGRRGAGWSMGPAYNCTWTSDRMICAEDGKISVHDIG